MWKTGLLLLLSAFCINQVLAQTWDEHQSRSENNCKKIEWSEATQVTSKDIVVRWDCCNSSSTPFYRLKINALHLININCDCVESTEEVVNGCSHTFYNLCPDTMYQITVSLHLTNDTIRTYERYNGNFEDNSFPIRVKTKTSSPGNVTIEEVKALNDTVISLKWKHDCPNGRLVYYNITWSPDDGGIGLLTGKLKLTVGDLRPVTMYTFVISACIYSGLPIFYNSSRCSNYSTAFKSTLPGAPSAPRDVKVVKTIQGEIYLKWKPPSTANGEINGYNIRNLNEESEVILPGSILRYHLSALTPGTNYTFSVQAFNVDGKERLDGTVSSVNYASESIRDELSAVENNDEVTANRIFEESSNDEKNVTELW